MTISIEKILFIFSILYVIPCAILDLRSQIIPFIPSMAVFLASVAAGCQGIYTGRTEWISFLLSLTPGLFLIIAAFLTGEKVGYGDGLVFLILGALNGVQIAFGILLCSLFLSSVISGILLAFRKVTMKSRIPLIPFTAISLMAAAVKLLAEGMI